MGFVMKKDDIISTKKKEFHEFAEANDILKSNHYFNMFIAGILYQNNENIKRVLISAGKNNGKKFNVNLTSVVENISAKFSSNNGFFITLYDGKFSIASFNVDYIDKIEVFENSEKKNIIYIYMKNGIDYMLEITTK